MSNIFGCRYFCDLEILCEGPPAVRVYLPQFPATPLLQSSGASSLLRMFDGSNEADRSYGGNVEEEVVVELDDSPGTANGTHFWSDVAHYHWATHECNRALGSLEYPRATAQGRKYVDHAHTLALLHSSGPLHWLVNTVMGVLDLLRVSNSPELKSFSLDMCIEVPESITKCLSSGYFEEGAGISQVRAGV